MAVINPMTPVTATGVNRPKKKKGKRKGPTGLYQGKAGEFAAQQDPEGYIPFLAGKAGAGPTGEANYNDWFNSQALPSIYGGYKTALGGNERLSLRDYMKQAGTGMQDQLNREYEHFQSDTDSPNWWGGYMSQRPEMVGAGNSGFYHDYLMNDLYNKRFADFRGQANNQMSFDEFLQGYEDPTSELMAGSGTYHSGKGKGKGRKKGRR